MIGQILSNNNERCYSNFLPTFRDVNTLPVNFSQVSDQRTAGTLCPQHRECSGSGRRLVVPSALRLLRRQRLSTTPPSTDGPSFFLGRGMRYRPTDPPLSAPLAPCSASACRVARRSSVWPEKMMGPQNGHVGYAVFLLHIHPLIIHILLLAAHGRVRVAACKTRGISVVLLCISIAPLCELLRCRAPTSSSVARVASMDDAQPLLEEMPPRWVCIEHSSH
jgi:hypothetical protein